VCARVRVKEDGWERAGNLGLTISYIQVELRSAVTKAADEKRRATRPFIFPTHPIGPRYFRDLGAPWPGPLALGTSGPRLRLRLISRLEAETWPTYLGGATLNLPRPFPSRFLTVALALPGR
jgi:hypothetical protein